MSPVEQIKARLNIVDVLSAYLTFEKAGNSLKAKCPFHNEKTPSFFVAPDRGTYYCFGCGAKGDIFSFVEQFEGLDFKGALKVLAEKAGVPLVWNKENVAEKDEKDRLYEIMEVATKFFEDNLKRDPAFLPYEYLVKRGLKDETIKEFRLGLALDDWRTLHTFLIGKGYKDDLIEKAGLVKKAENGKGYYDRFRNRIMFPISDSSGRVIAFTGRILKEEEQSAKYLNSPETPLFIKSNALYGIDKAKNAVRQKGYSVLVEGQMDLIMSHQAGFKNVIAGSGTALGSGNSFEVIRRLSNNIIFVYDADEAGEKAAERSADIALSMGMDVKIACLPDGLDPADAILKDVEIWRDALKNAKHVVEFVLDGVIKSSPDERRVARSVVEKVLPFVARLDKSSEQSHFLKIIKEKTGISESALGDDLRAVMRKIRADAFAKKTGIESPPIRNSSLGVSSSASSSTSFAIPTPTRRNDTILRKAVGLYFWQKSRKDTDFDFENFAKKISEILEKDFESIIKEVKSDESTLAFEAEAFYANSKSVEEEASNLLLILEEDILKKDLIKMMKEISEAERTKDEAKIGDLSKKWQITAKKITEIGKKLNK